MNVANVVAALCVSCLLTAQEPETAPRRPAAAPAVTVTLQFEGGTLATFVREVRGAQPKANIVVAGKAAEAMLPPIDLRDAGLMQALQGACEVAESDHEVRVRDFVGPGEPVLTIVADEKPARSRRDAAEPVRREPPAMTKVFSLGRLTAPSRFPGDEPFRVETILSAIEAATQDDKMPPVLRFHRDSGLLIVRGVPEQLVGVEMLLSVLENDRGGPRASRGDEQKPKDR